MPKLEKHCCEGINSSSLLRDGLKGEVVEVTVMFPSSTLLQPYFLKCKRKFSSTYNIRDLEFVTSGYTISPNCGRIKKVLVKFVDDRCMLMHYGRCPCALSRGH